MVSNQPNNINSLSSLEENKEILTKQQPPPQKEQRTSKNQGTNTKANTIMWSKHS